MAGRAHLRPVSLKEAYMKSHSYKDRAPRARDPRYVRILAKLGYGRRDAQAHQAPDPGEELNALRGSIRI